MLETANIHGTDGYNLTIVLPERSMTNDFDIDQTRRDLIALRVKHGAESPVGHRCSNLIEQLENLGLNGDPFVTADQRKNLEKSISRTVAELAGLQRN